MTLKQHLCEYHQRNLIASALNLDNKFRADQIWQWLYQRGAKTFDEMTNIPKGLRLALEEDFCIDRPSISKEFHAHDGTIKWLLDYSSTERSGKSKEEAETVFIPHEERGTVCVSSQIGCTLSCKFCHTGTQPLVRNLSTAEIVTQVMHVKDALSDWNNPHHSRRVTNVVFMGMGEPLLNYDNVAAAVSVLLDKAGLNLSRKRVTISTSGIVPAIRQAATDLKTRLAISLHAVTDELRNELVPINKRYPIQSLLQACRDYATATGGERITFEYVMLDGINDTTQDATQLAKLISSLPAKVNLIPFNPWPGTIFKTSTPENIEKFALAVKRANGNIAVTVRWPRGNDISAACGQLRSETIKTPRYSGRSNVIPA